MLKQIALELDDLLINHDVVFKRLTSKDPASITIEMGNGLSVFQSNKVLGLAKVIRDKYPDIKILICGNNTEPTIEY